MTIEEKAKAYDEALGRTKALYAKGAPDSLHLEEMFPVLKKSEDERIRKDLIQWIDEFPDIIWRGHNKEDIITWLEKQGKETQDPCEKCNHPMLNCCNFPCIQKKAFDQGKTIFDVMNEEKVDNQNCVKSAWSEDDEKMCAQVINEIEAIKSNSSTIFEKNIAQGKIDWLKSLKEKMKRE